MKLTRRGYGLVAVVVLAMVSASQFGARGLNAVVAPAIVALVYAAIRVDEFDEPRLTRELPRRAQQGSTVAVELHADVDGSYSARVIDATGPGLAAPAAGREVALGAEPVRYELFLRERGDQWVGPATVEARDVLGLFSRTFEVGGTSSILVRPPVYPLAGPRSGELDWAFGGGRGRHEFDFLRYYRRGDPLRDVHWRSSAKVPGDDLVVKEFGTDDGEPRIRLAGESAVGYDDEMAAATASVAVHLLARGRQVGLATADTHLRPLGGAEQHDRVLDALARTDGGPLSDADRRAADVIVSADRTGVSVEVADAVAPFRQVAGREVSIPRRRSVGADERHRAVGAA